MSAEDWIGGEEPEDEEPEDEEEIPLSAAILEGRGKGAKQRLGEYLKARPEIQEVAIIGRLQSIPNGWEEVPGVGMHLGEGVWLVRIKRAEATP